MPASDPSTAASNGEEVVEAIVKLPRPDSRHESESETEDCRVIAID